jgi:fucose 4-O-acetylase-like acetyltransferase
MVFLVFVHAYNLNESYLQLWTLPNEPLTLTGFAEYFFANGILRFRIPMLFIISGYLLAMNDVVPYKKRMGKKVKTLLYPYLIWSAFGLLITYIFEIFAYGKSIIADTSMVQIDNTRMLLHQYHCTRY